VLDKEAMTDLTPPNGGMMNPDLKAFREDLYREVKQCWENNQNAIPQTRNLKFGIFYSPVRCRPALMIVGANPGFDTDDDTMCPPSENLFYHPVGRNPDHWKIAPVLRDYFQKTHHAEILRDSVVTNLLFFKSRCLGKDRNVDRCQGWRDNPNAKARRAIEVYCRNKVEEIVRRLNPTRILILGTTTWDKLAGTEIRLAVRHKGNVRLAVRGTIFNKNALGIIHPTGARTSIVERGKIAEHLGEFLRN
jgi:hypothetical protein